MSDFIESSALRGQWPPKVKKTGQIIRNKLVTNMLMERSSVRVVMSPNGFGKSVLACQYSEIMFGHNHCFWIDASDPCFLRDLDSTSIFETVLAIDKDVDLVIFDNLIYLDEERSQRFHNNINQFIESKVEVIVTLSSINSPALNFGKDCIFIEQEQLLFDVDEISTTYNGQNDNGSKISEKTLRIPSLVHNNEDSWVDLLSSNIDDSLTCGVKFCLFSTLTTVSGSLSDITSKLRKSDINLLRAFAKENYYFGINVDCGLYNSPVLSFELIEKMFLDDIQVFVEKYFDSHEAMYEWLAQTCVDNNNLERAIEILRVSNMTASLSNYLSTFYQSLLQRLLLVEGAISAEKLFKADNIDINKSFSYDLINGSDNVSLETVVIYIWNLILLGQNSVAKKLSASVLDRCPDPVIGALCALVFCVTKDAKDMAYAIKITRCFSSVDVKSNYSFDSLVFEILTIIDKYDSGQLEEYLSATYNENSINNQNMIVIALIVKLIGTLGYPTHLESFLAIVSNAIELIDNNNRVYCFGQALFISSLSNCTFDSLRLMGLSKPQISKINKLNEFVKRISSEQYQQYQEKSDNWKPNDELIIENKTGRQYCLDEISDKQIPMLKISMYKKFEVEIGDTKISPTILKRKNSIVFLAILANNAGHCVEIEKIAKSMWPESTLQKAVRNAWGLFNYIRRGLRIEDGACPYIQRINNGVYMESKYLITDVGIVDYLYELFTISDVDPVLWVEVVKKHEDVIKGKFMTGFNNNSILNKERVQYANKIMDALICALERLIKINCYRESLWFARLALEIDPLREDVFYLMMKAQYQSGKRSTAIETYLACKKLIEEESDVPMSKRTHRLYENIVSEKI